MQSGASAEAPSGPAGPEGLRAAGPKPSQPPGSRPVSRSRKWSQAQRRIHGPPSGRSAHIRRGARHRSGGRAGRRPRESSAGAALQRQQPAERASRMTRTAGLRLGCRAAEVRACETRPGRPGRVRAARSPRSVPRAPPDPSHCTLAAAGKAILPAVSESMDSDKRLRKSRLPSVGP